MIVFGGRNQTTLFNDIAVYDLGRYPLLKLCVLLYGQLQTGGTKNRYLDLLQEQEQATPLLWTLLVPRWLFLVVWMLMEYS